MLLSSSSVAASSARQLLRLAAAQRHNSARGAASACSTSLLQLCIQAHAMLMPGCHHQLQQQLQQPLGAGSGERSRRHTPARPLCRRATIAQHTSRDTPARCCCCGMCTVACRPSKQPQAAACTRTSMQRSQQTAWRDAAAWHCRASLQHAGQHGCCGSSCKHPAGAHGSRH
jgi:hypothetical protein